MQEHILTGIEKLGEDIERSREESHADIEKLREESRTDIGKLREDMTDMKSDIAWIKGKLEGRSEFRYLFFTGISIVIAISAVIVAVWKG